ncbi:MAG: rhomboid family intramembrane serine protease [Ruminococcus sp.]
MTDQERYRNEDAIDRMQKGPVSWVNLTLILANILVFLWVESTGSSEDAAHMLECGAAFPPLILAGEYYRLFTCMFLHFGFEHLFNNMLLLFFLGGYLERAAGHIKYLVIYLLGGLGGSLLSFSYNLDLERNVASAGASGAVFAVIGAMVYIVIRNKGRLEDISLQRLLLMAALSIYFGFASGGVDNIAHIGGLISGFLICMAVYRKRRSGQ